jgi:long-chain acyl-CoA synthetase
MFSTGEMNNIAARFFRAAQIYGDEPAVGIAGEDAYLTYNQLAKKICECAAFLGPLERRQPIGLLSENRPEWCKVYIAVLACGGMVVPIDPQLKEQELSRLFAESRVRKLFVSPRHLEIAEAAAVSLKNGLEIMNLETIPISEDKIPELEFPDEPDNPAVMIFTSGTTGKAKKVILTHGNILSDIDGFLKRLTFGPGDRFLSVLPLHHTFEATCGFIAPLIRGSTIYYVKEINSREVFNGIGKHKITHFISVPLLYEKIYHGILNSVKKTSPARRAAFKITMTATKALHTLAGINPGGTLFAPFREKASLQSIRLLVSGGAPLPPQISRGFSLIGLNFVEGYGLTETSPVLTVNPTDRVKFGSVGPPLENVEIKIDNPNEKGIGEILARGPMITPGYEDNPEETAKLLEDGWLHTGDLGWLDKDGYLYIAGRKKNLIVSAAGKNIYPEEIEAELLRSPYILETLVYGSKGATGREEVSAIIYPDFKQLAIRLDKDWEEINPNDFTAGEIKSVLDVEIKSICRGMADYKRIKNISYIRQEFEKTTTRKIKRHLYI